MMLRKVLLLTAICMLLAAYNAQADADFGLNVDWDKPEGVDDGDWGIGARADFGGNFRMILGFDYYFRDAGDLFDGDDFDDDGLDLKFWEVNANLAYQFPTEVVRPYIGGGVGLARRTFDDIEEIFDDERTELGFNVLGGLKFGGEPVQPFVEFRGTFYGEDDPDDEDDFGRLVRFRDRFVISAGLLF